MAAVWTMKDVSGEFVVRGKGEQDAEIMLTILRRGFRMECVIATQVLKPSEGYFSTHEK